MSHISILQTRFTNFNLLVNTISELNFKTTPQIKSLEDKTGKNVVISQTNGSNVEFRWSGKDYEFIFDENFWNQPYSVKRFLDKISQRYTEKLLLNESKKLNFQPIELNNLNDGSRIIILERWSTYKTKLKSKI